MKILLPKSSSDYLGTWFFISLKMFLNRQSAKQCLGQAYCLPGLACSFKHLVHALNFFELKGKNTFSRMCPHW